MPLSHIWYVGLVLFLCSMGMWTWELCICILHPRDRGMGRGHPLLPAAEKDFHKDVPSKNGCQDIPRLSCISRGRAELIKGIKSDNNYFFFYFSLWSSKYRDISMCLWTHICIHPIWKLPFIYMYIHIWNLEGPVCPLYGYMYGVPYAPCQAVPWNFGGRGAVGVSLEMPWKH